MVASLALFLLLAGPVRPLVLAHYMPWYAAKPVSREWGWHWTMNHFDPEKVVGKRRSVASKFYPLIGAYDSNDPDVLECQVLLMKLSGIDGVIIDWYGREDVYDYALNHRNTLHLLRYIQKAGLKFAICYEDQTLPNLIKFGKVKEGGAVKHAQELVRWMEANWFAKPNYAKVDGRPILLVFGPQHFKGDEWPTILQGSKATPFGVMGPHRFGNGGFAWPNPRGGEANSNADMADFYRRAETVKPFLAGAYPRFDAIYPEAKVHPFWGAVEDRGGATYRRTFKQGLASKSPVIQLISWNDWGEGTQIEPSVEFGYRDLEATQELVKAGIRPAAKFSKSDLRLPIKLFGLRKAGKKAEADRLSKQLFARQTGR